MTTTGYTSKYSSYKKYITSSEVSFASNQRRSSYKSEIADEYISSRGNSSRQKEIITGSDTHSLPVYIVTQDFNPDVSNTDALPLEEGQIVEVLDSKNASSWLVRTKARPPKIGWAPGTLFETPTEYYRHRRESRELTPTDVPMTKKEEALLKRNAVFQQLMKSEEVYVSELHHLLETYLHFLDDQSPPLAVRQLKEQLSLNLREIYNFHANVLLKGFQYYSDDPGIVGQTFMRLERDFDHHIKYCHDEPDTEKLIEEPVVKQYFESIRDRIETAEKTLLDYLQLPIKRIQEYQQFLKEMIRYSLKADLPVDSLQKALELMLWIPKRAVDLNFIQSISDLPTDASRLGRLLRHDQFRVWEKTKEGEGTLQYVFLFKSKLVFTSKQESEDADEIPEFKFNYSVRIDKYELKDDPQDSSIIQLCPLDPALPVYYLQATETSDTEVVKQAWVKDLNETKEALVSLAEEETETMTEFADFSDIKSEFSEYSSVSRKSSLYGDGVDDGPPRKKHKTPPSISRSTSVQSLCSMNLESVTQTGSIEMHGSNMTRTQYGYRTLHATTAKMSLKVSGYPLPVITWFKDGVPLQEDERHKFYSDEDGFFAMTIEPVLMEDTGRYTCVATNEYGQATTSAFFRVVTAEREPEKPRFVTVLQDLQIHEGETAKFSCEVEGWPEPEIQFYLDGQAIHPSREYIMDYDGHLVHLNIRDVQPDDAGVISLKILNASGSDECKATLTVIEQPDKRKVPPEFQQVLHDVVVKEDDEVKFKVVCSGDPTPEVVWYVNGTPLTNSDKVNIIAEDGIYILKISNITQHFDGELLCRAINRIGEASCGCHVTVLKEDHAPIFEQELCNQVVCIGDLVKLQVMISASPVATVSWMINEQPIDEKSGNVRISEKPQSGIYVLEILNATTEQNGLIECLARNRVGEAKSQATLSVEASDSPPMFKQELHDIREKLGQPVELQVIVDSRPISVVHWSVNGREITGDENCSLKSDLSNRHQLRIAHLTEDLCGLWVCKAENSCGSATCQASVTAADSTSKTADSVPGVHFDSKLPPVIKRHVGEQFAVDVRVTGEQPVGFWSLNGKRLESSEFVRLTEQPGGLFRLEILTLSEEFSGTLSFEAQGSSGQVVSMSSELIVLPAPSDVVVVSQLPPSITAEVGSKVLVELNLGSSEQQHQQAEITWLLNGQPIAKSDEVQLHHDQDRICLQIDNISENYAGVLTCLVKLGNATETLQTNLEVVRTNRPPAEISGLSDTEVEEGDTIEFKLNIENAKSFQAEWFLNGTKLLPSDNVLIETTLDGICTLKFTKIHENQSGELECRISTPSGCFFSRAQLTVKPAARKQQPEICTQMNPLSVYEGDTLETKVALNGHPEPSVEWFLNGQRLSTNDNVHIETGNGMSSLRVKRVGKEMAGELSCVAKNLYGEVTTRTTLTVNHQIPVEFEQYLCDACCREGDTLKLKAILYGEPSPDVSWYINGKKLVESENIQIYKEKHTYIVVIHDITCDYSGEVVCKAVNEFGEASSSATLSVMRRGVPPDFLEWMNSISAAEGAEVVHRVRFSGDPKPTITWFINHQEIHNSDEFLITTEGDICTLTIKRFSARMVGEIICKAENDAGEVSCTAQMTLGTGRYLREEYSERSELEAVALSTGDIEGSEAGTDFAFSLPDEDMDEDGSRYESSMAPKFISKIKDTKVTIGKQAIFECIVPGSKGICVKWLKDGNEVELLARIRVGSHKEENVMVHRLIIDDVRREDAGYYTCVVMNEHGQETCVAKLEIAEGKGSAELLKPPQFISCLSNVNVKVGDKALFSCKVTGFPQPDLKWYKDGEVIETFDESTTVREEKGTYMLVIDAVEKKHEGEYICEATNVAGQVKTCAELKIQQYTVSETDGEESVAPHFTVPLYPQTVTEGSTADLSCFATGNPEPEIHWYKDEKEIHENDHFKFTSTKEGGKRLIVDNVHIVDEAEYTCEAVNIAGKASTKTILKVQKYEESECDKEETVLPKFTTDLQYQTVREGEQAVLTCVAKGVPSPEIYWFKNDERIQNDSHFEMRSDKDGTQTLIVCKAYLADQAEYKCEARNVVGSSFTQAALKVEKCETSTYEEEPVPPEFSTSLHYQKVNEGEQAVLMCTAKGHPQPEIYWYKNDQQIQEDEHFQIRRESDGRQKLIIVETVIDDQAKYTCEAVNTVGKSTTQTILEIQRYTVSEPSAGETVAPIFTKELEYQKISEGQQAVLTCVAHGQPTPEIHWYKDDEEINKSEHFEMKSEKDGTQKLIVSEVSTNDQAEYRCEAWNTVGRSFTQTTLQVEKYIVSEVESGEVVPPEFTIPLQYQNIYEGQQAVLECALKGHPKPEVRWFKGSEEIYSDGHFEMKSEADGTQKLILLKVSANDDAVYKCEARNVAGESYTEASLQVERYTESDVKSEELLAPEFTSALEYQKVYQGQQAMLKCVAKGQPTPEIHWYKDNEEIHKSEQFEMHTEEDGTQILILSKVSIDDEAEYRCEACNIAGSSYTQATLKVEKYTESEVEKEEAIPPEITTGLEYQKVYEGQQVILSCVAKSHPSPEVHWFKDGEEIQSDEHFQMRSEDDGTYKLIISNAVVDDQAEYKCETWNIAGKASTKTVLEVKRYHEFETESLEDVPPTFTTTLEHQQVYEGEQVVFQCVATGQPAPKISWYKDGEEIFNNEHFLMKSEENGTQTLILLKSSVDDQAEYTCEAWNAAGKSTTQTTLEVKRYSVSEVEQGVVPPEFTTTLEHQSVYEGQQALFTCVAKGYPAPEIHWFKDGVEIESDDHFQMKSGEDGTQILIVTKTCVDDQAEYRCEAWNMGGKSTTQTTLKVEKHLISEIEEPSLVAPEFITNLQYQKVDEGQQAILTCVAKGYPSPEIHWYKDGEEIKNDEHFKMKSEADGTQMLILSKPVIEDQAVYRCEAWNIVGKTSTQTTLDIERSMVLEVEEEKVEAPQFISSLRYDAIREGEQAVLTCVTKGSPVPEVRWYKDEQEITNDSHFQIRSEMDGTQKLIIIKTVKDDQAEYKCEAINVAGRSSTKSIFKIQESDIIEDRSQKGFVPEFVTVLEIQKAAEGATASFSCKVVGEPTPIVRWFKDGNEILESEHFEISSRSDGTQTLIVKSVKPEDCVVYSCEAVNVCGKSSTKTTLEIQHAETSEIISEEVSPSFIKEIESVSTDEGKSVELECIVAGKPLPTVKWYKDGEEITAEDNFITLEALSSGLHRLHISNASSLHDGEYRCIASNSSGAVWSNAVVEVRAADAKPVASLGMVAPEFIEVLRLCEASEHEVGTLQCKVTGFPAPEVRWFKDGVEITESEKYKMFKKADDVYVLQISDAIKEDEGEYRCEASNEKGFAWSEAPLSVKMAKEIEYDDSDEVAPDFAEPLKACVVNSGEDVVLQCKVTGIPYPDVMWYKKGVPVVCSEKITIETCQDGIHKLIIHQADESDVAEYRCEAKNDAGVVWSDATVCVLTSEYLEEEIEEEIAPSFVHELRETMVKEGEKIMLTCKVAGSPLPEVHWYKNGDIVKSSDEIEIVSTQDGTEKLIIHHAKVEDQGNYRCEAVNLAGYVSSKAPVSVFAIEDEMQMETLQNLEFTQPLHHRISDDDVRSVIFECQVASPSPATVYWYKDGVPIEMEEAHSIESFPDGLQKLILKNVTSEMAGHYTCKVKVNQVEIKTDDDLKVSEAAGLLEFSHGLKNQSVKKGSTVVMKCQINLRNRKQLPTVRWYKSGKEILADKRTEINSFPDGVCTLTITKTEEEDEGNYTCIISDGSSSVKTEATLTVIVEEEKKLSITKPLEDTVVPFGRDLTLEIEIQGQFESVKWYHGNKELRNSQRVKIEETDSVLSLFVKQADEESAGEYSVLIQMGQETVKSTAQVCVEPIPPLKITEGLTDLTVQLNDALQLSVKLTGLPEKVEWFKDGVKLKNSRTLRMESQDDGLYTLIVQNSSIKDVGRYEFKATNKDGSVESDALIKIKSESDDKPKDEDAALALVKGLTNQNVSDGEPFELRAKFSRKPKEVKWYKSGKQILPSKRVKISSDGLEFILEITDAKEDDSGKYEIEAFDDKGSVNSSADVNVKGTVPLKINDGLKPVELFSGETIRLAVNMVGSPDSVDWFKDGKKLEESANCEFSAANGIYEMTIKNCSMNDKGSYEFQASNSKGDVSSKGIVKIKASDDEKPKDEDVALTLVKGLSDQQINFGDTLELKIKLNRKPHRFIWYKNGKEIEPSPRVKVVEKESEVGLIITDATEDDAGAYKIVAELGSAAVDSSADVAVKKLLQPLKILKPLKDQKCTVGTKITFLVEISDKPQAIRWYKNGKQIAESKRVVMQSMTDKLHKLEIDSAELDDEGIYSVEVENKSGMAKSEAMLNILDDHSQKRSFKILRDLENQQVTQGETVLFSVEFSQVPKTVSWYKHMEKISPNERIKINFPKSTQCELELHNASLEDISAYRVEAMDEYGNVVSSAAELHVQRSPDALEILKDLEDIQILPGETATFKIQVKGKPKFVKWYKNGRILSGNDKAVAKSLDNGNYILTIEDASENDQAEYKCVLENDFGSVASEGKLTVGKIQKLESDEIKDKGLLKLLRGLSDHSADVGSKVEFSVQLQGFPENISWFANGRLIEPCYCNTEMLPNGEILCKCCIPAVKMDDAGMLKFQASNSSGTVNSECTLKVNGYPPKFLRGLTDRTTAPKCRIVLEVEIDQKPNSIKWYKDNAILKSTSKMEMISVDNNTYQLILNDIDRADAGSYSVEVTNEFGSAKSTGKLSVSSTAEKPLKPKITDGLKNVSILEGENAAFSATIEGKPTTVKWYRNGIELKAGPNIEVKQLDDATYKLILINCDKNKEGVIKIVASNDKGSDYSEAQLSIEIPVMKKVSDGGIGAKFVVPLENIRGNEKESLKLTCKVKGQPFPEITWLKDGQPLPADSRIVAETDVDGTCTLNISCVIPDDAGMYACVAQNHMGKDRTECELKVGDVRASEELDSGMAPQFIKPLRSSSVVEGENLILEARIIGNPLPSICWYVNDKEVVPNERIEGKIECIANEVVFLLQIKNARPEDAANYKCEATNPYGTQCSEASVTVEIPKPADQVAPKFVIPLVDMRANEGKTLRAEVKVRGRPTPELTWFKNKVPLTPEEEGLHIDSLGEGRWLLTMNKVTADASGLYECVATNKLGTDQCSGVFTIKPSKSNRKRDDNFYAPVFNVPLHDRRLPEKSVMVIECFVDANPKATIHWYKGDQLLEEDAHVQMETYPDGKCRLRIQYFSECDAGFYRCTAENEIGSATTSAYLSVEVEREREVSKKTEFAPFFTKLLQDTKTSLDLPVCIDCIVKGVPFPEIRWYKDGMAITSRDVKTELFEDGRCCLTIDKVDESNLGAYRCVASNVHGSSSCACMLISDTLKADKKVEQKAPWFSKTLTDTWVEKGSDLMLNCKVDGDFPMEIKWYKDGKLLRPSDRMSMTFDDDGTVTLKILRCSYADEGLYRCVAENSVGTANSMGVVSVPVAMEKQNFILPEGVAPQVIVPLENERCTEGDRLELNCQFSGSDLQIRWFKDGLTISSDGHIKLENAENGWSKLIIPSLMLKDEGSYRCVASNEFGSATTKGFARVEFVSMSEMLRAKKPKTTLIDFTVPLRDLRLMDSHPLLLECICSSGETPEIKWYKDGDLLQESDRVIIENLPDGKCTLKIHSCTPDDEGLYRCVAEDSSGSANTKSRVIVKPSFIGEDLSHRRSIPGKAPHFIEPLTSQKLTQGSHLRLVCRVDGDPMPSIRWLKDGDRIYSGGRHQMNTSPDGLVELIITNASPWDSGCYRCLAENEHGSARTISDVRVDRLSKKPAVDWEEEIKHGRAPGFIRPLTVKRVTEGDTITLECLPFGNPFPEIRWLKDGVEVSPNERIDIQQGEDGWQRLIIKDVCLNDDSFYRCVASNEYGTNSTKAQLIVDANSEKSKVNLLEEEPEPIKEKLRFKQGLANLTIHTGSPAEFECFPVGSPYPTVQWLKDGVPLVPSDRILTWKDRWGFQRLAILNATIDDEGEYKCTITNDDGMISTEGTLSILSDKYERQIMDNADVASHGREFADRPEIAAFLRHLKNKHVFSGFPVIFDCLVKGSQQMEARWYHNGKLIECNERVHAHYAGGGSYVLIIDSSISSDVGEYVVELSNQFGMISSSAVLDVTVPRLDHMSIDHPMEPCYKYLADVLPRRLHYSSIPTPPDRGPFIAEVSGHFLTLSWIPTKRTPPRYSQVTYIVEMRELPYREWYVVDYNIPQPCCKVRNMEHGKSYQFRIRAENLYGISDPSPPSPPSQLMAPPKPALDKYNRPIPLLDPYAQDAMNKTYGERYACAPWFSPQETDRAFCPERGKLVLSMFAHGYPEPEVKWLFRGWEIQPDSLIGKYNIRREGNDEYSLTIYAFSKEDVGQYQCKAVNDHGEAQQNVLVDLAIRPTFIQPLNSKVVQSCKPCRLDCRIDGTPIPEIKWYKDWKPLFETNRIKFVHEPPCMYSLIIETPLLRDSGVYACIASNEAGEVSSTGTVAVEAEPFDY